MWIDVAGIFTVDPHVQVVFLVPEICADIDYVKLKPKVSKLVAHGLYHLEYFLAFVHRHGLAAYSFQCGFNLRFLCLCFGFLKIEVTSVRLFKYFSEAL